MYLTVEFHDFDVWCIYIYDICLISCHLFCSVVYNIVIGHKTITCEGQVVKYMGIHGKCKPISTRTIHQSTLTSYNISLQIANLLK